MTTGSKLYTGPYLAQPAGNSGEVVLKLQSTAVSGPLLGYNTTPGLYRVSMMIVVTTAGTVGTMTLSCTCQSEGSTVNVYSLPEQTVTPTGSLGSLNSIQSGQFVVPADGTGDIVWQVIFNGVTVGALKFTVRVVAERITSLTA